MGRASLGRSAYASLPRSYALLSEGEKKYDRTTARKTLLAVIALGYRVIPPEGATPADGKLAGDAIEAKREGK